MLGAVGGMVASKFDSILNGPQKAMLVLHYTPKEKGLGSLGSLTGSFDSIASSTKGMLEMAELPLDAKAPTNYDGFVLQVQYNPSSINFTAAADSMPIKPLQPAFDASVPLSASVPPSVIMMIELIFDDIVVADSFMADKFNLSAGNVANNALLIKDALAGIVHSVQPQTNGLLAAMQRSFTRKISLYWGDMHFHGEIRDMQARYTMFSVSGRPVRSVVNMTIVQSSVANIQVINQYWEDSLDFIFPKMPELNNYSARTIAQKAGAIANINF